MEYLNESLPPDAAADFCASRIGPLYTGREICTAAPIFSSAVMHWREVIQAKKFLAINALSVCKTKDQFKTLCVALGTLFGNLAVQNAEGATVIEVFDRRIGRIQEGVRYHQTRQGGDIHTDSVNHPVQFRYFLLGCVAPAMLGGETIIVRGDDASSALAAFPDVLATLREPFWFEGRGMGEEVKFFQAPVLIDSDGVPRFRYLRSYIEAAHAKVGQPLTSDQVNAFDALDAVLESSALQQRFTLERGDVLICLDAEVFHGRTCFIDRTREGAWADRRLMYRLWINGPA